MLPADEEALDAQDLKASVRGRGTKNDMVCERGQVGRLQTKRQPKGNNCTTNGRIHTLK